MSEAKTVYTTSALAEQVAGELRSSASRRRRFPTRAYITPRSLMRRRSWGEKCAWGRT